MGIRDEMKKDAGNFPPAVRFENEGEWQKLTLVETPHKEAIPDRFDGNKLKDQWVVQVEDESGELATLYLGKPALLSAVLDAQEAAGVTDFTVGDMVAVRQQGEKPSDKGNPQKLYEAAYKPVAKSTSGDAMREDAANRQTTAPAPAKDPFE